MSLLPGWSPGAARGLLRFGRGKFPAQISNMLLQQFDRIALGALLPVGMVSFYVVPLRISQRIGQVAENVASPFYPAVASHLVADRLASLREQYRLGVRAVAILGGGVLAILGGLAGPVLSVWMGQEFADQGTWPFRILLLAYTAASFFTFPSVAADAAARPGIPALFLSLGSLIHIVFIWFAVPRWGLVGAATGVLVGFSIPLVLGIPALHRKVPALPPLHLLLLDLRGILISSLLTLTVAMISSRSAFPWEGVPQLLLSLIGCGLLYLGLLIILRGIHRGDLDLIFRVFRRDARELHS
jgi:O-antigen/teichoic acid export membrane protein